MKQNPIFSVVIPTCHRNDLLAKCLDCLAPGVQTLAFEKYEVIVTDDGSETTAEEMIHKRYSWARWVQGPKKGPAANRNNGAQYAKGEWLVFLDDDCVPDHDILENYKKGIKDNPNCKVFEGSIYANRPKQRMDETGPFNETGGYLVSCNFTIKKSLFESIGKFDERFPYAAMEDPELYYRIKKAGYEVRFIKAAAAYHPWKKFYSWKTFKQKQKSTFIYLKLHPEERKRLNSFHYFHVLSRFVIKEMIPGIIKYKGKGWFLAMLCCLSNFQMIFLTMKCNYERRDK